MVKIHIGPIKSCGTRISLVEPMRILTNQRECVEMCVASIPLHHMANMQTNSR